MDYKVENHEIEISVLDAINFLLGNWKKLFIAGLVGVMVGYGCWVFLVDYSAEYWLSNTGYAEENDYGLDTTSWTILQKSLPNLARKISAEHIVPDNQVNVIKALANEQWWKKNVKAYYVDPKDLLVPDKRFNKSSAFIQGFNLTMTGANKADASDNVMVAANFMRTGGAYLQLRELIDNYEAEVIVLGAELQNQLTSVEIEMNSQIQRAKNLEELRKRFPTNSDNKGLFDPSDSNSKYLPIESQIVAVNTEINDSKQALKRIGDRLDQLEVLKIFTAKAKLLLSKTYDGIILADQLLEVERSLRADIAQSSLSRRQILDSLRIRLHKVETRFALSIEARALPVITENKGVTIFALSGLTAAMLLMFLALLIQKGWSSLGARNVNFDSR